MRITTSKSRKEVKQILKNLRDSVRGNGEDTYLFKATIYSAVAHSLLDSVHTSYLKRAYGGSDELGVSWEPLKVSTIAYKKASARKNLRLPNLSKKRPTLTATQDKLWRLIYASQQYRYLRKQAIKGISKEGSRNAAIKQLNNLPKNTKTASAAIAWSILKSKYGAKTLLELVDRAAALINIETGDMLASLEPNEFSVPYRPKENQIAEIGHSHIRIKSKLPYIAIFRKRPLWPQDITLWKKRAVKQARKALLDRLVEVIE